MKLPFFKRLLRRQYSAAEDELWGFLRHNRLFARLTQAEAMPLAPHLHLRHYKQNEAVFFRGDPSQALYIIKAGRVNLELDVGDKFETVVRLQSPASFGNNSLLPNTKRIFNAIVTSPLCELYVLPQVNIRAAFEQHPPLKATMLENLSEVYNENLANLCKTYRLSHGFFELGEMFKDVVQGI